MTHKRTHIAKTKANVATQPSESDTAVSTVDPKLRRKRNEKCGSLSLQEDNVPIFVSGPKLRRMIGISAVTLWRWRNGEKVGFPKARMINGRLYFVWDEVLVWLAKQQRAA